MRRRQSPAVHLGGLCRATIRFVGVPTTPLVQLEEVAPAGEGVQGAIVKVAPTLRASEREGFHGAEVAARLRGAGARAVQLAPVIIPEVAVPRSPGRATLSAPADLVRAHFEELRGVPEGDRAAALELAVRLVEEVERGDERQ